MLFGFFYRVIMVFDLNFCLKIRKGFYEFFFLYVNEWYEILRDNEFLKSDFLVVKREFVSRGKIVLSMFYLIILLVSRNEVFLRKYFSCLLRLSDNGFFGVVFSIRRVVF